MTKRNTKTKAHLLNIEYMSREGITSCTEGTTTKLIGIKKKYRGR